MNENPEYATLCVRAPGSLACLDDESVDLICTDPPYGLASTMRGRAHPPNRKNIGYRNAIEDQDWDMLDDEAYTRLMRGLMDQAARILKPQGTIICFCPSLKTGELARIGEDMGLYYKMIGYWLKPNSSPLNMQLQPVNSIEPFAYLIKPSADGRYHTGTFNNQGRKTTNLIRAGRDKDDDLGADTHPTAKPISLMTRIIELFSNPGDLIVDPFMGSGSTGVAAIRTGRRFWGADASPHWTDIATERIRREADQPTLLG